MKYIIQIGRPFSIGVSCYLAYLSLRILVAQEQFALHSTGALAVRAEQGVRALIILGFLLCAFGLALWRRWIIALTAIVYSGLTLWAAYATLFPAEGDDRRTPLLMGCAFVVVAGFSFLLFIQKRSAYTLSRI